MGSIRSVRTDRRAEGRLPHGDFSLYSNESGRLHLGEEGELQSCFSDGFYSKVGRRRDGGSTGPINGGYEKHLVRFRKFTQQKGKEIIAVLFDKRTWLKTLSWRIVATTMTISIFTGFGVELRTAIGAGLFVNMLKMIAFYAHESLWERKR